MRVSLAAISRDRVSSIAVLTAGLLCGVSVFFVALPLAQSSPFPTPKGGGWVTESPRSYALASASTSLPVSLLGSAPSPAAAVPDSVGEEAAIEWESMIAPSGSLDAPLIEARLAPPESGKQPEAATTAEPEHTASIAPIAPEKAPVPAPAKRNVSPTEEVDNYLWEVYQRVPVKKDRSGDFTWKDPAAAKRMNMSLQTYVIGGMDRDFREQLYHAGRAMDAEGIQWSMLSAFRDDYRQRIAAGFKARGGNSLHGGSRATGGYGHGRAIDIISADGDHRTVWRWVDRNGRKYGLARPMPGADPAHIQAGGDWHRIAAKFRDSRVKVADQRAPGKTAPVEKTRVAKAGR
jgi:hypothetical protein